jgi:hypothetical protein
MRALFVLLPLPADSERLLADLPQGLAAARARLVVRCYPPADDERHLWSLVRAGRDPIATRRWRGLGASILLGAVLSTITAAILATAFDMLGGMLQIALPFGLFVGAFLGGFAAAMTGTESACDEVRELAKQVRRGDVLASFVAGDDLLLEIIARCAALGIATRRAD